MTWYEKVLPSRINTERRTRSVPEGLWIKCPQCSAQLYRAELERNLHVCPKCGHHMRLVARDRLMVFLDAGTGREIGEKLSPSRSAALQGQQALPDADHPGPEGNRRAGCARGDDGPAEGPARRGLRI